MSNYNRKILFLGPIGSYTQIAAETFLKKFSIKAELEPVSTITKILDETGKNPDLTAVVPVENSIEGIVRETLDNLLGTRDVEIIAQTTIPISHCLISNGKKENIKTIISHPQALAQCQNYICKNFGADINIIAANSTSRAVAMLSNLDNTYAALGSEFCADIYKVDILEKNINDNNDNQTRFVIVGQKSNCSNKKNRTSIAFSTKNETGALLGVLEIFKKYNLNLVYIESRPSKKVLGEYVFFADIDRGIEEIDYAIEEIKNTCDFYKLLGSYYVV